MTADVIHHHELFRTPPPIRCEVIRRVVTYLVERELADYEATPLADRQGHIYRDLHEIDCWLSNLEACDGWDFPAELPSLGEVQVEAEVQTRLTQDEVDRMLDDHRMRKWGAGPDIAAGEGNASDYDAIREHTGSVESYPTKRGVQFFITTAFRTTTTLKVHRLLDGEV